MSKISCNRNKVDALDNRLALAGSRAMQSASSASKINAILTTRRLYKIRAKVRRAGERGDVEAEAAAMICRIMDGGLA